MSQTDVSSLTAAVTGIQIEGPGGPRVAPSGRVELNDQDLLVVLPGEIDSAVGSQPAPVVEADPDAPDDDDDEDEDEDEEDEDEEDDSFEQDLADKFGPGIDSVTITGPGGTRGKAAIKAATRAAVAGRNRTELFDASEYAVGPTVDGRDVTDIVIAFSGSVTYPASNETGLALYESLRLGKDVELRIAGVVATKQGAFKEATKEDREDVVKAKAGIKVHSLRVLTPEQL